MKKILFSLLLHQLILIAAYSQSDTISVMYYNVLGFPGGDPGREVYFRTINQYLDNDVIVICELPSNAGALALLNQSLNVYGSNKYSKAAFTDGPDSDNMLFYNNQKLGLKSQYYLVTGLRYINEYKLYYKSQDLGTPGCDTVFFYIYVAHLKAGDLPENEQQRLQEVAVFKQRISQLPNPENIIFGGDLNIYSASEPAYDTLVNPGYYPLNDPLPAGTWHNNYTYRYLHTQSTRTIEFGGGSTGGLDDRFDFTLFSDDCLNGANDVTYITGTCKALGNDGSHFNKSLIEAPAITMIPDSVVQALYYMSDHLPVISRFKVDLPAPTPMADLMITEIMQNPFTVTDAAGEWFEVYNAADTPFNLSGCTIKDDGSDTHVISGNIIIPANGFVTLGINSNPLANGNYPCDYQYSNFYLSNTNDEVVIVAPNGINELTRVNYSDLQGWPDPNGASMVFIGSASDPVNNNTFWETALVREPEYSGSTGDKGSPGAQGSQQNLYQTGFNLDLKLFLQGPFNAGSMNTSLSGVIPLSQPYNQPPWNYPGTEAVAVLPSADIVDWVLIELRDASAAVNAVASTMIERQAAFLMKNGMILKTDAATLPSSQVSVNQNLFVVVHHRNHLKIISSNALINNGGTYTYDFSASSLQVYGGSAGYRMLQAGIWGMVSGDGNANGQVTNEDKNTVWKIQSGSSGYKQGDFNLDMQVNNTDKNTYWTPNTGMGTQVP